VVTKHNPSIYQPDDISSSLLDFHYLNSEPKHLPPCFVVTKHHPSVFQSDDISSSVLAFHHLHS
jgi:hypothetical protein